MICAELQECIGKELKQADICFCPHKKEQCIVVSDQRSEIKCEENRKKYILANTRKKHVILYKMDGGIIVEDKTVPTNINKCDYLFIVEADGIEGILTELKGVDVKKAFTQLNGTLDQYQKVFKNFNALHGRVVVTSATPRLNADPAYVKLKTINEQIQKNAQK